MESELPDLKDAKLSDFELKETISGDCTGHFRMCSLKGGSDHYIMKCMRKRDLIKRRQVRQIVTVAELQREISHPFVMNTVATFQDEKRLFIVVEYMYGGEMFTHLRSAGRFPNDVAKFYVAELVLAFEYLHSKDIIYRDLKPENLLLDSKGHVKITDFGLAKKVPEGELTHTLCGTPEYLPPEMIQNKGHGRAVDWWALGILLFEFIAGYPPFYDDTPFRVYENILEGKIKFPSWFDSRARDLVKKLLMLDPTKRLGALKNGAADVKNHPYFHGAKWDRLLNRCYPAPIPVKAKSTSVAGTSLYDEYPELPEDRSAPLTSAEQAEFKDF